MADIHNPQFEKGYDTSDLQYPKHQDTVKVLELPSDLERHFRDLVAHHPGNVPNIGDQIVDIRFLRQRSGAELIPSDLLQVIEQPYQRMIQHLHETKDHTPLKAVLLKTMSNSLCMLAHRVLSKDRPCLLLLDRDDTIDGRIFSLETMRAETLNGEECPGRCVRPGLPALLEHLPHYKKDLEVGILTARSPESIFDSHSAERSEWLRSLFSSNHVYSTALWRVSEESSRMSREFLATLLDPSSELFLSVDIDLDPNDLPRDDG